ncbi:50S ribosomal protein L11 methyltransferase [Alkalimarinus sediminis]|uniref:Ribosomal protein L11 methyltransferase n=1 Tax=Alkalimarinus sediminis TaxID=1632866 RepID=A0A9E8HGR7_9ALTE|nr:50S ribosomal protein L11 methyltransferase [Alkalimarinus sediminis]UZW74370.1 50S ribosomal protein L11 methyltransferase [Alkalimarinus sediminis]
MPWIQVKIDIHPAQTDSIEELLLASGACAVTLEDGEDHPIYEPDRGTTPLWTRTQLTGLFDASADMQAIIPNIEERYLALSGNPLPAHRVEILEDKDWERAWMDNFHPMLFGKRLWICPSWKEPEDPDAVNLMLDPGLAFGTGTHPTTALCLAWLDAQDMSDKVVVDYGCGSGILGIAALLLGAKRVIGVDNDPQALEASRENTRRNNIAEERFEIYLPGEAPDVEADIMIANILAQPLISLSPTLASMTKQGGLLVLSGILEQQASEVSERYSEWFDMDPSEQKEEWMRLSGTKR